MSLKALAANHGMRIGCGPVDTTGGLGLHDNQSGLTWDAKFPYVLDAGSDSAASVIASEFSALDLCGWAVGNTDLTHYGQASRWTAPGVYNFTGCDETYAFAAANGMNVIISDPAYSGTPAWVLSGGYTPAQLTTLLHDWYQEFYTRYPLAHHTTLCNELLPITYDPYDDSPSNSASIDWWFRNCDIGVPGGFTRLQFIKQVYDWVHGFNPSIRIVMNQWGVDGFGPNPSIDYWYWLRDLLNMGAQLHGAGLQSHFTSDTSYNPATYQATLESFGMLGIPVYVTEFDVVSGSHWLTNQFNLVKAIVDAGVTDLTFWSIHDPLFYGSNGAIWTDYGRGTGNTMTRTAGYDQVALALGGGSGPQATVSGSQASLLAGTPPHGVSVMLRA